MSSKFAYQARRPEQWQKAAEGNNFASPFLDQFETFKATESNWIRILPPTWKNPEHYGLPIYVHFGVGPDAGTILCEQRSGNTKCPICEAQARAEIKGEEDLAKEYKPTRRILIWLIDRNDKEKESEKLPKLWAMPQTLDQQISSICKDRRTGELYQIDHPDSGYDVTFDVTGKRPMIKYVAPQIDRNPSSVEDVYLDYVSKYPLPEVIRHRSTEEVRAMFEGINPAAVEREIEIPAKQVQQEVVVTQPRQPRQPQQEIAAEFCSKTVKIKGELFGCALAPHTDNIDCEFDRSLSNGNAQPEPVQQKAEPAPVSSTTEPSATASRLRSRFTTGGTK